MNSSADMLKGRRSWRLMRRGREGDMGTMRETKMVKVAHNFIRDGA